MLGDHDRVFVAAATRTEVKVIAGYDFDGVDVTTTVVAACFDEDRARQALIRWIGEQPDAGEADRYQLSISETDPRTGAVLTTKPYEVMTTIRLKERPARG